MALRGAVAVALGACGKEATRMRRPLQPLGEPGHCGPWRRFRFSVWYLRERPSPPGSAPDSGCRCSCSSFLLHVGVGDVWFVT